jgi:hypothetical protein
VIFGGSLPKFKGVEVSTQEYVNLKYGITNPREVRQPIELGNVDRDDLASLFAELGFTKGAEIGVETGKYSQVLLSRNPNLKLNCIDAWEVYRGYREHLTQSKVDGLLETAKDRLKEYSNRTVFIKKYSADAAKDFPSKSLDFVYIDANHTLPYVIQDLYLWEPKVRHGGIIAGHDYCKRTNSNGYQVHVVEAVGAWAGAYQIKPWYVVGSKEIREGEKRDRPRSFFWVKP